MGNAVTFMFRQSARLCVDVPCVMGEGDLLDTTLISIINHWGCHFQIPFPLPNLLNLILYHTTKPSMRDGSDNKRWLSPLYRGNVSLAPSRGISHFLSFHVGCSVSSQPRAIRSPLCPYFTVALFTSGSSVRSLVAGVPKSSILLDLSAGAFLAYLLMHPVQDTSKMHFINLNNLRLYIFFQVWH